MFPSMSSASRLFLLQRLAPPLFLLPLLLLLDQPRGADSIVCYKCNAIDVARSDCPGNYRRPVDTFHDLHDRGGLYTHCMEIKLRNGTVLKQVRQTRKNV